MSSLSWEQLAGLIGLIAIFTCSVVFIIFIIKYYDKIDARYSNIRKNTLNEELNIFRKKIHQHRDMPSIGLMRKKESK